jgi:hypothetical protein
LMMTAACVIVSTQPRETHVHVAHTLATAAALCSVAALCSIRCCTRGRARALVTANRSVFARMLASLCVRQLVTIELPRRLPHHESVLRSATSPRPHPVHALHCWTQGAVCLTTHVLDINKTSSHMYHMVVLPCVLRCCMCLSTVEFHQVTLLSRLSYILYIYLCQNISTPRGLPQ